MQDTFLLGPGCNGIEDDQEAKEVEEGVIEGFRPVEELFLMMES